MVGSQELGSFVVHEITRDADGEPDSVAIDFESHCDFEPPLKGKIRINSTVPDDAPGLFASAGQDIDALEDQLVELNAEGSYIGPTAGASYQWQQISGPPVVIMDDTQPVASFVAPGGAGVAVFQVTITTAEGLTATATVSVNLLGSGALTSGLYLESTTGEPFLEGKTIYFGPGYPPNSSFQSDRLTVSNNGGPQFRLFLKAADGNPLLPGDYANAFGLYELESQNGIDFRPGQSSCDSAVGWFRIYEIVPSADQKEVDKLAADFWQSCEYGDSPIHGAIRINSSIPFTTVAPVATAGPNAVARAGTEVTLDAAQSFSWNSSVSNYVWKQLSGPAAAISGANTATPRIALPPSTGQTEYLEFEVSVRNDFGQVDKARATVTSLSEADPTSELIVSLFDLNTRQEFFSTKFDIANSYFDYSGTVSGMKVDVFNRDIGLRFSLSQASDQFPVGSKVYHQYSGRDQTFPDFNTNEFPIFRCFGSHDGWLHVRDIVVNDDVIESIAYEIEQACENGFGVRTSARFDSTVPLDKGNVVTIQAADMTVEEGSTVDLYDVIAYIEGEVARDVSWQHLGGPQPFLATYPSARTVFVAPNVDSDEVVRLQLELTSWAGQTYTDEIEVTVVDNGISGMPAGLISTSTATGTYQATGNAIAVDSNQLIRLETHSPNVVSGPFEPDVAPFGTMTLEFQVPADGDSTNATIYFQQPLPANSSWLIHDDYGGWLMYDGTWSIAPDRQSIRFEIADGGPGDLDFRVDKRVLITGGIGASQPALPPPPPPPPAPQPTGGGGGGSMAPVTLLVFFVLIFNRRCRARMNIAAPVLR